MAIARKGNLLHAPDMYMEKLCVGPRAKGRIDLTQPVQENLRRIAEGLERGIDDLTVVILDRPRHQEIIDECRSAGARIKLITDGDVSPAVDAGIEGSGVHVLMGIGGAPEGVLAAAALKCLGGDMQARLIPYTDEERKRCWEMGIDDINRVMTLDDLVKGDDCIFSATAITDTPMMRGVQYFWRRRPHHVRRHALQERHDPLHRHVPPLRQESQMEYSFVKAVVRRPQFAVRSSQFAGRC